MAKLVGKTRAGEGYRFECLTRDALRGAGYDVIRAAASKGPADIVGIRDGELLFIQCKYTSKFPVTSLSVCPLEERKEVIRLSRMVGAVPLLAHPYKEGHRAVDVAFKRLTGPGPYDFQPWSLSRVSAGL